MSIPVEQIAFGHWRVNCDREATRLAYSRLDIESEATCECTYCRNFAEAVDRAFSTEVLTILDRLGIDIRRAAEVYELGRLESGLHLYGGWYHCVGEIVEERVEIADSGIEWGTGPSAFYLHDKPALVSVPFKGLPLLQFEFSAEVPWVLHEPPEPE